MRTKLVGLACALALFGELGCSRSGTSPNAAATNSTGPAFTVAEPSPAPTASDTSNAGSRSTDRTPANSRGVTGTPSPPSKVEPAASESAVADSSAPAPPAADSTNPPGQQRSPRAPALDNAPALANEQPAEHEAAAEENNRESIAASLAAMRIEPSNKTGTEPGDTIPEIEGKDLDGERFALSDYQGKVLMIDFWGDW